MLCTTGQFISSYRWNEDAMLLAKSGVAVAHTGTTNETILATYSFSAGQIGANGAVRMSFFGSQTSSANNKTWRVRLGGLSGTIIYAPAAITTTAVFRHFLEFINRNSQAAQVAAGFGTRNTDSVISANANTAATVDTSAAVDLVITAQLASAGETMTLDGYIMELIR